MKTGVAARAVLLACATLVGARAEGASTEDWHAAMTSARWTGPLLASTAETLPPGHFYTEPYFFDVISSGHHTPGSSGFYQYGLLPNYTVGVQPFFSLGTRTHNHDLAIGDFKLVSQLRISHFTANHRVPSIALVMNVVMPTGKYDNLEPTGHGHGSGAFAPEIGVNIQQYFLLNNGRLLRVRLNFLKTLPLRTPVTGRSVYGTSSGFEGHARPGSKTTLTGGMEYSLSREWVLALDVERDEWAKTRLSGRDAAGRPMKQSSPRSWNLGFAPALEYNWSDRAGAIIGVWVVPKGHNSSASVTPAIAIQRFW